MQLRKGKDDNVTSRHAPLMLSSASALFSERLSLQKPLSAFPEGIAHYTGTAEAPCQDKQLRKTNRKRRKSSIKKLRIKVKNNGWIKCNHTPITSFGEFMVLAFTAYSDRWRITQINTAGLFSHNICFVLCINQKHVDTADNVSQHFPLNWQQF